MRHGRAGPAWGQVWGQRKTPALWTEMETAAETTFLPASMLPVSEKRARPKAPGALDEMALYLLRDQQE